jgi:hypothetical protein
LIDLQRAESGDEDESLMRLADAAGSKKSIRVLEEPEVIVSFLFFTELGQNNEHYRRYTRSDGGVPKPKKLLGGKSGKRGARYGGKFRVILSVRPASIPR